MQEEVILTEDQQHIYDQVVKGVHTFAGRYDCNISGQAGSGKTTLASVIIESLALGFNVVVTSPTHKANRVIADMIHAEGKSKNCEVMTIHSFLGLKLVWKKDKQVLELDRLSPNSKINTDVLIVEEGSMISRDMYQAIMNQSYRVRRSIIFLGDIGQLPPVEQSTGPTLTSIAFDHGVSFVLSKVLRQAEGSPIISVATKIRECIESEQDPLQYLHNLTEAEAEKIVTVDNDAFFETFISTINSPSIGIVEKNAQKFKILAYTNRQVESWNNIARMALFPDEDEEFFCGEPLILNTSGKKCPYGTQEHFRCPTISKTTWFGVDCWSASGDDGIFYMVGPRSGPAFSEMLETVKNNIFKGVTNPLTKRVYQWADYYIIIEKISTVSYPYALTWHKSQGSTFENVWLDINSVPRWMNNSDKSRAVYTAVTRPQHMIILTS